MSQEFDDIIEQLADLRQLLDEQQITAGLNDLVEHTQGIAQLLERTISKAFWQGVAGGAVAATFVLTVHLWL